MIRLRDISLSFRQQVLFAKINCDIQKSAKMALVGRNGSGKSTFLRVLAGQQFCDNGSLEISPGYKVAYMPQEVVFSSIKTVFQEAFNGFSEIVELQEESRQLEVQLESGSVTDGLISRYSYIKERLSELDIAQAENTTRQVLIGLGFKDEQLEQSVNSLSVGWKMRLVLARLLLQKADFYLFDEPTNHLDIFAKEWFLQFLKRTNFGFLLVCHERYFLDQLCKEVLELELGKAVFYKGNYSQYQEQKILRKESTLNAYNRQQKEIARKKVTIERFRASASKAKMAQSMIKSLEKMELITVEPESKNVSFSFLKPSQSGREVLKVEKLCYSFNTKKIFENCSFLLGRGERVALMAPNGVGKTTLFNIIAKKYQLQSGKITYGHNVTYAIFDQDQGVILDPNNSVIEEVEKAVPKQTTQAIRSLLGAFLFGETEITKKTSVLSGGEKNRVSIVKVLLQNANFLLLDEPTNHLDIQSKDILLQALKNYSGTILFVSHDHDFINNLATRVLELTSTGIYSYSGNYDSYLYHRQALQKLQDSELTSQKNSTQPNINSSAHKNNNSQKELFELRKKSRKLEDKIERIEREIELLQSRLTILDYNTPEFNEIYKKLAELEKVLKSQFTEWEKIQISL